jgi:nitrite reductase/ring-hydroxylating ferredoxin subunit/uncharacterized membrane protein
MRGTIEVSRPPRAGYGRVVSATQIPALERAVEAVESASVLDAPASAIAKAVRQAISPGTLKDVLSGTWLGHPLHPLLTDVVIGSWTSANLLDLLGGDGDGRAAERLIAVGMAAYFPTATTGVSDWADAAVAPAVRRAGIVHATANAGGFALYTASFVARRRGARTRGKLLGLAGLTVLGVGGYLGSHLSYTRGVGPNETAFDAGPEDWTPAVDGSQLVAGRPMSVTVGETPVLMLRHADGIHALHDRCSHRGCSLAGGEVDGETVTCPCHGSQFSLRDGSVRRGPATSGQPAFDVRESAGRVEIRLRQA